MKRDRFIAYCFIALLIFVVIEVFRIFSPFFNAIFWSAILTFGFYPVYIKIKASRLNETVAALLMTLIIFIFVVVPMLLIMIKLSIQAIDVYGNAKDYVRSGGLEHLIEDVRSWGPVQKIESNFLQWEPMKERVSEWILSSTKAIANFSLGQVGVITKNIVFVSLNIILVFFLVFIFLKDGNKIYDYIYNVAPLTESNKKAIFSQINETLSAVIRGQILTSLVQSFLAGFIFAILGLPAPLFFAAATFMFSLIPILGAQAIWFPWVIYLAVTHETQKAIILAVLGIGVISTIDNIIKPAIIGEKTKLPYFLLFFGILGGLRLYGLMGVFLAPVILSLFFAVVKIYRETFH